MLWFLVGLGVGLSVGFCMGVLIVCVLISGRDEWKH